MPNITLPSLTLHNLALPGTSARAEVDPAQSGVLPVDPPRAHASGPAPYRILAVGGGPLAGYGVVTHDLALPGTLARGVARFTEHGVDVESVVTERASAQAVTRALKGRDLSRFDAVVAFLAHSDDPAPGSDSSKRTDALVSDLWRRLRPGAAIALVMAPASDSRRTAEELASFVASVEYGSGATALLVRLPELSQIESASQRYGVWGQLIAERLAKHLHDPLVWEEPLEVLDERKRVTAVRRLGPLDAHLESLLERFVSYAGRAYGARCAAVTVIDGSEAHFLAHRGSDTRVRPREQTFCDVALRTYGGLIVGDALEDERFRDLEAVRDGSVRFYAGYRVESPDGQPVAALCVYDSEPRPVMAQDLDLLRDLALGVERRIWEQSHFDRFTER